MSEANLNIGEWDIESLRVTIFPPSGFRSANQQTGLWEEVTGEPPEAINSNPRQGLTRVQGSVRGNQLILGIQAERMDWHVPPHVPSNEPPIGIPKVGDSQDMLGIIHDGLLSSLRTIAVVHRLAFAPVLVREVPDVATGMQELSRYLPNVNLDPSGSADFMYQINRRRRSSSVHHAEINRLGRWSVEEITSVAFRMMSGQRSVVPQHEGTHYVRKLVTDINTTPATSAMSNDRIHDLFHEMVILTNELAIEGDVS